MNNNMPPATMPATMVDVAREAGVSLKTVSRVLNKEIYVREATKAAVLNAAAKLDYRLNQAARTLRGGSPPIILLLMDNPNRGYVQDMHFGALEQCQQFSMQLLLNHCPGGFADVQKILKTLAPAGVILTPPLCDDPEILALLNDHQCPFVLITPRETAEPAPVSSMSVNMDDVAAAREITEHLIKLGHRRIGFIRGHPSHSVTEKRYGGYCEALRNNGISPDPEMTGVGLFDYAAALECAEYLLDHANPPTAIFASNDDMAAAAIAAAYRRNIPIPGALSVVGFDDTAIAAIISPQLTTIRQPICAIAAQAVLLLSDHNQHALTGEQPQRAIFLDYALIIRDSAGPAR